MASKNIKIEEKVFEELMRFRDDNNLASYTEAIRTLLNLEKRKPLHQFTELDESAIISGQEAPVQFTPVPQAINAIEEMTLSRENENY